MKVKIHLLNYLCVICLVIACKSDSKVKNDHQKTNSTEFKYQITPFSASPTFSDARIADMSYKSGNFNFSIDGSTYKLGTQTSDAPQKMCANSAKGQHIHLIVDNGPYAAKYVSEFEHDIEDGEHYILAFLSRSYHESIKSDGASIARRARIEAGTIQDAATIEDPMLFYSRPKGTYTGDDTKKVMLDFYLYNTDISATGNYVEADINGEIHKITKWQPYYIEGMPNGDNTIKLSLKDASGKLVNTPLNPVSRTFKLLSNPEPAQ